MLSRLRRLFAPRPKGEGPAPSPAAGPEPAEAPLSDPADFDSLLTRPRRPDRAAMAPSEAEIAADTEVAARLALARPDLVRTDVEATLDAMIAHLDARLSGQMTEILHHPAMQAVESAWRGLHFLVSRTEPGARLRLRVLDIDGAELDTALAAPPGEAWRRAPLAQALFDRVFADPGAAPFGVLMVDRTFGDGAADVDRLAALARLGALCRAPVLVGLAPDLYAGGARRGPLADAAPDPAQDAGPWHALRRSESARYLALCLPRILARLPYGDRQNPVPAFAFEERVRPDAPEDFVWIASAWAMAAAIGRSETRHGWPTEIRGFDSGGRVDGLPVAPPEPRTEPEENATGTGAEAVPMRPLDLVIEGRAEADLARRGLLALMANATAPGTAAFVSAQSLALPPSPGAGTDPDEAQNAAILARLPYLLLACRYAHPVMRMAADWPAPLSGPEDARFEAHVRAWLARSVDPAPWQTDAQGMARRPLQAVAFALGEAGAEGRTATMTLWPGFRLEGLGAPIRLTFALPARPLATAPPPADRRARS